MLGESLQKIDGGYRVAETETHYIDVLRMTFSWRICETPKAFPEVIDRHWCYNFTRHTLLSVLATAKSWAFAVNSGLVDCPEPAGWNKNGQTGEWRPDERGC